MWVIFLFAAAIGLFTFQNISFKQFNRRFMADAASYFMFSGFYFVLVCGIFIAFGVDVSQFTLPVVALGLMFAVSFVCAIFLYMKAMEHGPLSLSFLFFSAGMLWPILFGIIVYGEPVPLHKAAGLLLLFAALFISTRGGIPGAGETSGRPSRKWAAYILFASFSNGIIGIAMLLFRAAAPLEAVTEFLFLAFGQAALIVLALGLILLLKNKKTLCHFRTRSFVPVVLCAAVTTAFGNYIMIQLSLLVSALVQFPVINGSLVITSILASRIIFKEAVTKSHLQAIAVGLAAIVMLSI